MKSIRIKSLLSSYPVLYAVEKNKYAELNGKVRH